MRTRRSPRPAVPVLVAATAAVALATAPAAAADDPPVKVVASGLSDPWSVRPAPTDGGLVVAENATGEVTWVKGGQQKVLTTISGGLAGADVSNGKLVAITGGGAPDARTPGSDAFFTAPRWGGRASQLADLLAYETANNPDGQVQQTGPEADAWSNPFSVIAGRGKVLAYVADGGANDVLAVDSRGRVSTFFVPPLVTEGECATRPDNFDPPRNGCDPVPTGLAWGPDGHLYVATLSGEAAGLGRVYVLDRRGRVVRTITGLDAPTGVAVDGRGNVYVSEVVYGAPEGEPGPDFDVDSVGRIVKVDRHGEQWYTDEVTAPLGLLWKDGALYSTAYSVLGQLGPLPDPAPGQVVKVSAKAFHPLER